MFEQQPEDIFAGTEPAKPEPLRPRGAVSPTVPGRPGEPSQVGATQEAVLEERAPKRRIFLIVMVAVIVLILGAGGYLVWSQFIQKRVTTITPTPAVIDVDAPAVNAPAAANANVPVAPVCGNGTCETGEDSTNCPADCPPAPPPPVAVDTDQDGLPDAEEATLGTDPTKVDTDDDSLTDREEVKIYATDPLNPDTDGDTYLDGNEVKAGYNPKGTGKLLELPQ